MLNFCDLITITAVCVICCIQAAYLKTEIDRYFYIVKRRTYDEHIKSRTLARIRQNIKDCIVQLILVMLIAILILSIRGCI